VYALKINILLGIFDFTVYINLVLQPFKKT